jgi:hypothetical protein
MSLSLLDRALGVPPLLEETICDFASVLTQRTRREVERVLMQFEARFPQITVCFLTCEPPGGIPLRGYLFWLFNHSEQVPALENGGSCRLLAVAVDPVAGGMSCMVGYGLEPFLGNDRLAAALADAEGSFANGHWGAGLQALLIRIGEGLDRAVSEAPRAFGLLGEPLHLPEQLGDRPFSAALSY